MFLSRQKKRAAAESLPSIETLSGLFDCYNFFFPNEYSERTFDVTNTVISQAQNEYKQKSKTSSAPMNFTCKNTGSHTMELLDNRRLRLKNIPASLEKCMIINGLISFIEENEEDFERILLEVVNYIKPRMIDCQLNRMIKYPEDFRRREEYFGKRRHAQNLRRLSYFNANEVVAPNLIYLQNRTNEHLRYIIDSKMRYEPSFQTMALEEIEKIFATSFLILDQPHSGVNPVTVAVASRGNNGIYDAAIDVTIICLLNDFIQSHPDVITLSGIVPRLHPESNDYKLIQPEKISWNICQLCISTDEKPHTVLCAKVTAIKIKVTSASDKKIHFPEQLHAFHFLVKLNLNLKDQRINEDYNVLLNSSNFMIVTHTDQVSHAIATVILDDIRQYSQFSTASIDTVAIFILRYFKHRTGVEPKQDLAHFLREQLKKASNAKSNCDNLDDIYLDFLFLFVNQIEFMAKHPILAMWYEEGLFLGPCDSEKVEASMRRTMDSTVLALRFDSIRSDLTIPKSADSRKSPRCHIRVDVYSANTNNFEHRTFDWKNLIFDILKFISTASEGNSSAIRILSTLGDGNTLGTYKVHADFKKYYHKRLTEIYPTNEKYESIVELLVQYVRVHDMNQNEGNTTNGHLTSNSQQFSFQTIQELIIYVATNPFIFDQIIQEWNNRNPSNTFLNLDLSKSPLSVFPNTPNPTNGTTTDDSLPLFDDNSNDIFST